MGQTKYHCGMDRLRFARAELHGTQSVSFSGRTYCAEGLALRRLDSADRMRVVRMPPLPKLWSKRKKRGRFREVKRCEGVEAGS